MEVYVQAELLAAAPPPLPPPLLAMAQDIGFVHTTEFIVETLQKH